MSNVQTVLRKRSITPEMVGKMVLSDFIQTRKNFLQDPSIRSGSLEPTEKELLISRANLSPNRRDMVVYLVLRDILHELSFRQELAVQGFEVAYCKLSHLVELTTIAERENKQRIEKKARTSTPLFEAHRAENILNQKNMVQSLKASMVRSVGFLKASNVALACISRAVSMPSIEGEMVGLDGFLYDIAELENMVSELLGVIQRDGKEPAYTVFPDGVPVSVSDWAMCLELCQEGQRMEAEDLKRELGGILKMEMQFDQTAVKLYEKTFSLQKILKDGVADLEKLTNNLLKTHEIGGQ